MFLKKPHRIVYFPRTYLQHISLCSMRGFLALAVLPLLASSSPVLNTGTIHNDAAPLLSSTEATEIPDSYIVVFKKDVSHHAATAHHSWVQDQHVKVEKTKRQLSKRSQVPLNTFGGLKHTYNLAGGLLGYSGHFDEDVIERVRRHPDVSTTHSIPHLLTHVVFMILTCFIDARLNTSNGTR